MRDDDLAAAVVLAMRSALAPVIERLAALETIAARSAADAELLITREVAPLRERLVAVESRPPVPGPPGANGADGRDGDRGPKGDPGMRYRDVYKDAERYDLGDVVTWAGGAWHCNEDGTTARPGDSKAWTLIVKRGRDAKGAR